jgi:hypothetical protein
VSSLGAPKTVTIQGNLRATVNIEVSTGGAAGPWAPATTFLLSGSDGAGARQLDVAAQFMRATVVGFISGSAVCGVGADDRGALFANLPAPAGNGVGAQVDVSTLGTLNTVVVGGTFRGSVVVEISQDGGATWTQELVFTAPGSKTSEFVAEFMRVRRSGVPAISPGLPSVDVGAVVDAGTGIGGSLNDAYNFGGPGAGRTITVDSGAVVMNASSLSAAAGTETIAQISGTIDQAGTAAYRGLEIDITENTTGSGASRLISAGVGGSEVFSVDPVGLGVFGGGVRLSGGTAASVTDGLFHDAADELAVATAGVEAVRWNASQQTLLPDGTSAAPALSFSGNAGMGVRRSGTSLYYHSTFHRFYPAPGSIQAFLSSTQFLHYGAGTAALPTLQVGGSGTGSGIYYPVADSLGITAGGAEAARIDKSTTAADTRLLVYDVDNGALARVSVGPNDSGGAGFKLLRVPN